MKVEPQDNPPPSVPFASLPSDHIFITGGNFYVKIGYNNLNQNERLALELGASKLVRFDGNDYVTPFYGKLQISTEAKDK